jgi:hypothetical protein
MSEPIRAAGPASELEPSAGGYEPGDFCHRLGRDALLATVSEAARQAS